MSTRLIPTDFVKAPANQQKLLNALIDAVHAANTVASNVNFYAVAPVNYDYKSDPIGTSATPAWRSSVLHLLFAPGMDWNVTISCSCGVLAFIPFLLDHECSEEG